MMKPFMLFSLTLVAIVGIASACKAQEASGDVTAIESSIQSYIDAFNKRDAKALAAHWSPEGVYMSRISGEGIVGRDALEQEFAAQFEQAEETKLDVAVDSIQFISPNVALEQGTATVLTPDEEPVESSYSVVHVKRDGKWLIDRVSEDEFTVVPSHYENLKDLEWMIGEWADHDGAGTITTECSWTRNQNFITRSFAVKINDDVDLAGMQVIGWDANRKQIRAWTFDSDGGFAESEFRKHKDRWIVQTVATLPDGRRGSSTSVFRPIDEDRFGWQKINRLVDGDILPNIDEIEISRKGS